MSLYLLTIIAAIITLILGWAWHGPFFGKPFARAMGMKPEDMDMSPEAMRAMYIRMAINIVATLPTAFVLFMLLRIFGAVTIGHTAIVIGILFVGFSLPQTIIQNLWNARPTKDQLTLAAIGIGYNIVNFALWGALYVLLG